MYLWIFFYFSNPWHLHLVQVSTAIINTQYQSGQCSVKATGLLLRVLGSSIDWDINYPEWDFSWFSLVPPGKFWGSALIRPFIHSFLCFPFVHLQVQPKDVEIVILCWTMYLLNYRCQMTEYNYNTMITQ